MSGLIEILGCKVAGVEFEGECPGDVKGGCLFAAEQGEPSDIRKMTMFLRHHIINIGVRDLGVMDGKQASSFAVRIILMGPSSKKREILITRNQIHSETNARKVHKILASQPDFVGNHKPTIGVQGVAVNVGKIRPPFPPRGGMLKRDKNRAVRVGLPCQGLGAVLKGVSDETQFLPFSKHLRVLSGPELESVIVRGCAVDLKQRAAGKQFVSPDF